MASQIVTMADVLNELRETELNLTQTLLACNVGKKTKQRKLDFLHGQIERIRDRNSALLARIEEQRGK